MDLWTSLLDILVLLLAAFALGTLCERLKQSAILGYLLAGVLLGPNALNLMPNHNAVAAIAELGVALLLFTIGLEFSWRRLRGIGPIALIGGTIQVVVTLILAASVCVAFGVETRAALVVGAMVALSSTACVLRLLVSRAEIDTLYGRNSIGILLLQDIAVVPLVLVVTAMGSEEPGSPVGILFELGKAILVAALLIGALFVVLKYVLPLLLSAELIGRNRDLSILLAVVTAIGTAWASRQLGLSPVLGAFIAGMMIAESPFALQIRADISPLRSLFVTLFFSSIGMLGDPAWVLANWPAVAAVVAAIVLGKAIVVSAVVRLFRSPPGHAIATGVCLAQVGEFSFVLLEVARPGQLLDDYLFELMIAVTIVTLFLTPYLVALAPHLARVVGRFTTQKSNAPHPLSESTQPETEALIGHTVIIGFGPSGQRVAESLIGQHRPMLIVIELNARTAALARTYGLRTYIGDATRSEILEHVRIASAKVVVVTVPDPATVRHICEQVRSLAPQATIIARARYHKHRAELYLAGAEVVIDEEQEVGRRMAAAVRRKLRQPDET